MKVSSLLPAIAFLIHLTACSDGNSRPEISKQIEAQYASNKDSVIDLSKLGPTSWDRVCVLRPYSDNSYAEKVLGVKWNVWANSSIGTSDSINLLVFLQGNNVVAHTEHPRSLGDFSKLSPACLNREKSNALRRVTDGGWTYLVSE